MAEVGFRNMATNKAISADLPMNFVPRVGETIKVQESDKPTYYLVEQVIYIVNNIHMTDPALPEVLSSLVKVEVLVIPKE